jgi:hypothetical protein
MDAYNNSMAIKSATMQSMPVINYSNLSLPNQATSPTIDYQQLKLKALEQQAAFQNYSIQQMEKSDEVLRKNSLENNTAQAYTEPSTLEYQYNPAYNPSSEVK